jgi:hypothetical protein
VLGNVGARSGTVAGSFVHLIDQVVEPRDGAGPRHLHLIHS